MATLSKLFYMRSLLNLLLAIALNVAFFHAIIHYGLFAALMAAFVAVNAFIVIKSLYFIIFRPGE